jgi:anti-sigma-K factor RskA
MTTEHEHWSERSEIYGLGALAGEDLKEFQDHRAAGCAICETRIRETHETLSLLPRSLIPVRPDPKIKARILDEIDSERAFSAAAASPKEPRRWQRITGTLAAGIIGIILSGAYYRFRYEPRHTAYSAVVNLLRDPRTRDLPLYGAGPTPAAKGRFLWNPSGEGHIFASNLPTAPQGKMYAVWTIAQPSQPRYVGTIATDATGQGGLHFNSAPGTLPVETFAVTLEREGATAAPAGPIVLVSKPS